MAANPLQALCERGQLELMQTRYLAAAATLAEAEREAWSSQDFDTLARLYLPLQEARRQIRQRCGEGRVAMHCLALSPVDLVDPGTLTQAGAQGQLLTAGWGTIQPAVEVRSQADLQGLYLETFLAAVYPVEESDPLVVIVPLEETPVPDPQPRTTDRLRSLLPAGCLLLAPSEIPPDAPAGNADTFANVMDLWERLHRPFLDAAAKEPDPILRMQACRLTLRVDPACELAHQFLAQTARELSRRAS